MSPDASQRHEVWNLLDAIQMDLRGLAAKWTELRAQVAALDLPDPKRVTCPACALPFRSSPRLAEHMYLQHDGPEPPHWLEAALLADDPDTDDTGRLESRGKAAGVNGLTAPVPGDEA